MPTGDGGETEFPKKAEILGKTLIWHGYQNILT